MDENQHKGGEGQEQEAGLEALPKETLYQILAIFGLFPFLGSVAILWKHPPLKLDEGQSILAALSIEAWIALAIMIGEAAVLALWITERIHRKPESSELRDAPSEGSR